MVHSRRLFDAFVYGFWMMPWVRSLKDGGVRGL